MRENNPFNNLPQPHFGRVPEYARRQFGRSDRIVMLALAGLVAAGLLAHDLAGSRKKYPAIDQLFSADTRTPEGKKLVERYLRLGIGKELNGNHYMAFCVDDSSNPRSLDAAVNTMPGHRITQLGNRRAVFCSAADYTGDGFVDLALVTWKEDKLIAEMHAGDGSGNFHQRTIIHIPPEHKPLVQAIADSGKDHAFVGQNNQAFTYLSALFSR